MQYSTAGGPLIAVVALVVILLLCRWTFGTGGRYQPPTTPQRRTEVDYGLLVPVATTRTSADAALLRDVLRDADIRGTIAPGEAPGHCVVLVFASDADRARSLVASHPER